MSSQGTDDETDEKGSPSQGPIHDAKIPPLSTSESNARSSPPLEELTLPIGLIGAVVPPVPATYVAENTTLDIMTSPGMDSTSALPSNKPSRSSSSSHEGNLATPTRQEPITQGDLAKASNKTPPSTDYGAVTTLLEKSSREAPAELEEEPDYHPWALHGSLIKQCSFYEDMEPEEAMLEYKRLAIMLKVRAFLFIAFLMVGPYSSAVYEARASQAQVPII